MLNIDRYQQISFKSQLNGIFDLIVHQTIKQHSLYTEIMVNQNITPFNGSYLKLSTICK